MIHGYLTSYEHIQHTGNQLVILSFGGVWEKEGERETAGLSVNTTNRDRCKNLVWDTGKHRRTTRTRPDILCFLVLCLSPEKEDLAGTTESELAAPSMLPT